MRDTTRTRKEKEKILLQRWLEEESGNAREKEANNVQEEIYCMTDEMLDVELEEGD